MVKKQHTSLLHGFEPCSYQDKNLGRVKMSFNEEDEVKVALRVPAWLAAQEHEIAEGLWQEYCKRKTQEWQSSFETPVIVRADGTRLLTPLHSETKAYREREFDTVLNKDHPAHIEIRREGLVTMIKIADQRHEDSSVLRRAEIRIDQQKPGFISFKRVPNSYGRMLSKLFNQKSARIVAVQTQSWRDKITVPIPFEWRGHSYVFEYERAKDVGVARSRAGHVRNITEFEGEVKAVFVREDYISGSKVDIKTTPKHAGLTREEFKELVDTFLHDRLDNFLNFANGWLQEKSYEGCFMAPVTHSKSWPEMQGFHQVLATASDAQRRAIMRQIHKSKGFSVNETLTTLRQTIG